MKRDQSKYKYLRDEWRKNNPTYAKEHYEKVKNNPKPIKPCLSHFIASPN